MLDALPLEGNPFAALTAVAGPAILTNACSVLSLGTANRLARVVDRTRVVTATINALEDTSAEYPLWMEQLERLNVRAHLLLKALQNFYAALGLFAAAALIAIIGSVMSYYHQQLAFQTAAIIGLGTGSLAVLGLVSGCTLMVRETRLAVQTQEDEARVAHPRPHSEKASQT